MDLPFSLSARIKTHIEKYKHSQLAVYDVLSNCVYFHDLICSFENTEKTLDITNKARKNMNEVGFNVRKWATNGSFLMKKGKGECFQIYPLITKHRRNRAVQTFDIILKFRVLNPSHFLQLL